MKIRYERAQPWGKRQITFDQRLVELVLLLAYGESNPSRDARRVLRLSAVARAQAIPLSIVRRIIRMHKHGRTTHVFSSRPTMRKLLPCHVGYLTSQETLRT